MKQIRLFLGRLALSFADDRDFQSFQLFRGILNILKTEEERKEIFTGEEDNDVTFSGIVKHAIQGLDQYVEQLTMKQFFYTSVAIFLVLQRMVHFLITLNISERCDHFPNKKSRYGDRLYMPA
jgi:hypothetical protein